MTGTLATINACTAEIARLVGEKAHPDLIAGARERRAKAEQAREQILTQQLVDRIRVKAGQYRSGMSLTNDDVRLLAAEINRLKGFEPR